MNNASPKKPINNFIHFVIELNKFLHLLISIQLNLLSQFLVFLFHFSFLFGNNGRISFGNSFDISTANFISSLKSFGISPKLSLVKLHALIFFCKFWFHFKFRCNQRIFFWISFQNFFNTFFIASKFFIKYCKKHNRYMLTHMQSSTTLYLVCHVDH